MKKFSSNIKAEIINKRKHLKLGQELETLQQLSDRLPGGVNGLI